MAFILDGKIASSMIYEKLKEDVLRLKSKPCLAIIHFLDPASVSYLKGRHKVADEIGCQIIEYPFLDNCKKEDIINTINELNNNPSVDGIMIDRPLPKHLNEKEILSMISHLKDVDGYTPLNLGSMVSNDFNYPCCTPSAAIRLLKHYNVDLVGKNALVIGRSVNVGKPLSLMLLNENATVTIAHSKTRNLSMLCQKADIIFLCIGKRAFLKKEDVNENTIIVDIGINFDENNKMCGDASKECYDIVSMYSPVPKGVGVMTNVVLMENLLLAYKKNHE